MKKDNSTLLSSFEQFTAKNAKILWGVLAVLLIALPFVVKNQYFLTVVAKIGCYAILALKADATDQSDEKKVDDSESDLIQEMKYNEIICLEKTADWDGAKSKMLEYQESYPNDTSVEKEAEFLQTR